MLIILLSHCNLDDKQIGTFGVSQDLQSSRSNHLLRARYLPDKFQFRLFDSSVILIDTAWAETEWIHGENGKINIAGDSGYNMIIPIPTMNDAKFNFEFEMADRTNDSFGGEGPSRNRQVIYPRKLNDKLKIVMVQINPDTSLGWTRPLVTDTIIFTKIK